ncbi:UNVERIFIED_CONTAM: hypothetical protein FKN15_034966 [Acipenser sinensis]
MHREMHFHPCVKADCCFPVRDERATVIDSYQYDDGCEPCGSDTFNREPFVVKFSSPHSAVRDFAIIPQHTSPSAAVQEIDALYDVCTDLVSRWQTDNILLMGDFNAGCSYVTSSKWPQIRLRTDLQFQWLIPDSVDTTVTHTHCPYDRSVLHSVIDRLSCFPAAVRDFAIIPQHTSPSAAVQEIDALYDVCTDLVSRWQTDVSDVLLLLLHPHAAFCVPVVTGVYSCVVEHHPSDTGAGRKANPSDTGAGRKANPSDTGAGRKANPSDTGAGRKANPSDTGAGRKANPSDTGAGRKANPSDTGAGRKANPTDTGAGRKANPSDTGGGRKANPSDTGAGRKATLLTQVQDGKLTLLTQGQDGKLTRLTQGQDGKLTLLTRAGRKSGQIIHCLLVLIWGHLEVTNA